MSTPWISSDGSSLLVPITAVKRFGNLKISLNFDIGQYGFAGKESNQFTVTQIPAYDGQPINDFGSFTGSEIKISTQISGRHMILLEIK